MDIIVHRGLKEIGGTCLEIIHSGCRIIVDLGIPLTKPGGGELTKEELKTPAVLPKLRGLYTDAEIPTVDGVLLSHAHMDHYGLMDFIHPEIPVYLSEESLAILEVGNIFWPDNLKQKNMFDNYCLFDNSTPFEIGPFIISALPVDHSSFGASAFLLEANGKKIFYTGDFRAHGRKPKTYYRLLKDEQLKNVDALIIEGTTLGQRSRGSQPTEQDVEKQMADLLKKQEDVSFVVASGSNIDRLNSIFKATRSAGKELVLDLYQYYLLSKLKETYSKSKLPPFKGDGIRIFINDSQKKKMIDNLGQKVFDEFYNKSITAEEIISRRKDFVLRLAIHEMTGLAEKMQKEKTLEESVLIYSMWSGYLKKQKSFQNFSDRFNVTIKEVHSSGHAYKKDIVRLVDAINPKRLIPVHTLNAGVFKKTFTNIDIVTEKLTTI